MKDLIDADGTVHTAEGASTTLLDTKEFAKYIKDIIDWTENYLNISIPQPNMGIFLLNEKGEVYQQDVKQFFLYVKTLEKK